MPTGSGLDRRGDGPLDGPPVPVNPPADGGGRHAGALGPFNQGQRFTAQRELPVLPGVAGLLPGCRPPAILRAVALTVVSSVDRHARLGLSAHVGEEVFERAGPPLADGDAPAAVIPVTRRAGAFAAGLHSLPGDVFGGRAGTGSLPVSSVVRAALAPARLGVPRLQIVNPDVSRLPAHANAPGAKPVLSPPPAVESALDSPMAVTGRACRHGFLPCVCTIVNHTHG